MIEKCKECGVFIEEGSQHRCTTDNTLDRLIERFLDESHKLEIAQSRVALIKQTIANHLEGKDTKQVIRGGLVITTNGHDWCFELKKNQEAQS